MKKPLLSSLLMLLVLGSACTNSTKVPGTGKPMTISLSHNGERVSSSNIDDAETGVFSYSWVGSSSIGVIFDRGDGTYVNEEFKMSSLSSDGKVGTFENANSLLPVLSANHKTIPIKIFYPYSAGSEHSICQIDNCQQDGELSRINKYMLLAINTQVTDGEMGKGAFEGEFSIFKIPKGTRLFAEDSGSYVLEITAYDNNTQLASKISVTPHNEQIIHSHTVTIRHAFPLTDNGTTLAEDAYLVFLNPSSGPADLLLSIITDKKQQYLFRMSNDKELQKGIIYVMSLGEENQYIRFADDLVQELCLMAGWDADNDGRISFVEAAKIKDIGTTFARQPITTFAELQYFLTLDTIRDNAFAECRMLEKVAIPDSVRYIGNQAFTFCEKLDTLVMGRYSKLSHIGVAAFSNCPGLNYVVLPRQLQYIDDYAFAKFGQHPITIALSAKKPPRLGNNVFYGTTDNLVLQMDSAALPAYKADAAWQKWLKKDAPQNNKKKNKK